MGALDAYAQPVDRTAALRSRLIIQGLDDDQAQRDAQTQALEIQRQANERAQADEKRQTQALDMQRQANERAQAEEKRRAQEDANKTAEGTALIDARSWAGTPSYSVPYHKLPQEARDHFDSAYPPAIAARAPEIYNRAVQDRTGIIPGLDDTAVQSGATLDPITGKAQIHYKAPEAAEGMVFESPEAAETAGFNPEGGKLLPNGQVLITKVARNDISRRKLGVNEKNALTGAVTAATTLDNIERDYEALNKQGKVGPIAGRIQEGKQSVGAGDEEYSKFSAQAGANLFNLARALQGAGVLTEQDVKRMESIAPTGKMNPQQFRGQIAGVRKTMAEKLKSWRIVNEESLSPEQRTEIDGVLTRLEKGGAATASPAATPGSPSAVTPAPSKPKIVRQNGVIYTLQPDGSYR